MAYGKTKVDGYSGEARPQKKVRPRLEGEDDKPVEDPGPHPAHVAGRVDRRRHQADPEDRPGGRGVGADLLVEGHQRGGDQGRRGAADEAHAHQEDPHGEQDPFHAPADVYGRTRPGHGWTRMISDVHITPRGLGARRRGLNPLTTVRRAVMVSWVKDAR